MNAYTLKYWHKHAVQGNLIHINVLASVLSLVIYCISKAEQCKCSLNISSKTIYCRPKPWLPDLKESNSNIKASSYQEENDAANASNCMHIEKGKKEWKGIYYI